MLGPDPIAVRSEATGWDDVVKVRMVFELACPGVEDAEET